MRTQTLSQLIVIFFAAFIFSGCSNVQQPFEVAPIFTDHMVLQANKSVCIWGKASAGVNVSVSIRNQVQTVKTDRNGDWKIYLNAESYGETSILIITTKNEEVVFSDILYGEVWLCSGQSNMEMPLISNWAHVNNAEEEAENANYPEIRLFTVDKNLAFQPIDTIGTRGWEICDSVTVKYFSATAYFYGRYLYQNLKVPIGLVHSSWGGTVAEAWTSKASLENATDFSERTRQIAALSASRDSLQAKYDAETLIMNQEILKADDGFSGKKALYADPAFDDMHWTPIDLPKMWEETELGVYDGSTWFRKHIVLSENQANQNWVLHYGAPDDWDEAWVNGVKVGENKAWNVLREYTIPQGILNAGENVLTLRVYDFVGGGGFMGEAHQYKMLSDKDEKISIAKGWLAKKGFDFNDIQTIPVSLEDPNQPTVLFNAMINPLLNMTFQGAIWYQGESNSGRAKQYRGLFKTMINDWRAAFNNGAFPFYFVQLANYLPRNIEPVEDSWAELREAQSMALELGNTGMAVTIDIGDALDIHPGNKQDVGTRLALNALANTYDKSIEYSGPHFKSYQIKDNGIEIEFDFNNELSSTDGEKLIGFSIAGKDSVFVWASAKIEDSKVIVSSSRIKNPIAVRYAWSSNPACNLTNETGLPASPFRTDNFKGITE